MTELFETLSKLAKSQDVREHVLVYSSDAFVIIHELESLQSQVKELQSQSSWVKVSEQTPQDTLGVDGLTEYNVCDRKGNVYSAYWNNGTWIDNEGERPGLFDIWYWQPLPQPPSEVKSE